MIKSAAFYWTESAGLKYRDDTPPDFKPSVVFYFADKRLFDQHDLYALMRKTFPDAPVLGCSTSGAIFDDDIFVGALTGVAISFEKTKLKFVQQSCTDQTESRQIGKAIAKELLGEGLCHVFILTDGMMVHGTNLLEGMNEVLPTEVAVTGGMASDGFEFKTTLVGLDAKPSSGQVCAIGFYGSNLKVGYGAYGGWDAFGIERTVTKSDGNVLYELDGQPALDLYKEYLGAEAEKLPGSGLLFPLAIRRTASDVQIIRTIDKVDEAKKAVRFSGDIPQGWTAQFMRGDFGHLAEGAKEAARRAQTQGDGPQVAIAVSCLGRQLLMGQRVSDELGALTETFGADTPVLGFYSNGEFSHQQGKRTIFHNQTMTITAFRET
jgi:hypothetical protein